MPGKYFQRGLFVVTKAGMLVAQEIIVVHAAENIGNERRWTR